MKLAVAIPIKASNDPLLLEGQSYLDRITRPFSAQSIFVSPKASLSEAQKQLRMDHEGELLLQKTVSHFRVALTVDGRSMSSEQFASWLESLSHKTSKTAFIIGGAFGLSSEVVKNVNATISLSSMTMPHKMAFLVLCEQLYRAGEILRGSPYHK